MLICSDLQVGKTKYHKSHHFDYANEVSMMVGAEKPGIGGEALLGQKYKPRNTVFPKGEGSNLPVWVAFDRQVTLPSQSSSFSSPIFFILYFLLLTFYL